MIANAIFMVFLVGSGYVAGRKGITFADIFKTKTPVTTAKALA